MTLSPLRSAFALGFIILAGCSSTVEDDTKPVEVTNCYKYERLRDFYEETYGEEPPEVTEGKYLQCLENPFVIETEGGWYVMNHVRAYDMLRYSFTDKDWPFQFCATLPCKPQILE